MKQADTLFRPTLDERQLAIVVRLCIAAYREVLDGSRTPDSISDGGLKSSIDDTSWQDILTAHVGAHVGSSDSSDQQVQGHQKSDHRGTDSQSLSQQTPSKLLLSIEEAARMLGIGRSLMYELVRRRELASITIGRVRRIPVIELEAFVHRRLEAAAERSESVRAQVCRVKPATKGDEAA